jgi:uncharacterized protein
VDTALVLGAALMGLAGTPHCLAMCGATSAGVIRACAAGRPRGATVGFHLGRLAGYAAAGALAAASVATLRSLGETAPLLRPLWTLLHLAVLGLGLWLMWTGRQPAFLQGGGAALPPAMAAQGWQRVRGPVRSGVAGLAWVAWPCGLLQSALVVATLAGSAGSGALVMAVFAMASSVGLVAGPRLWLRLAGHGDAVARLAAGAWAVRLAGLVLAGGAAWALGHGLWLRVAAWCTG